MPEVPPAPSPGPPPGHRPDRGAVRAALSIDRFSDTRARTIDLTTTGARSRRAHRIETRFSRAGDELHLTTAPARRDRYAHVLVNPATVVHLGNHLRADLPATAVPATGPTRCEQVLREVVGELRHPENRGGVQDVVGSADDWIARSPLVRIDLDDPSLSPGDRPGGH